MQNELFKRKSPAKTLKFEKILKSFDKRTFEERRERLVYINKIFPKNTSILSDPQTVFIFGEAKMTFINGEFISTILLSQAFIERRLQIHYESLDLGKIAKRGLKAIIEHATKHDTIHHFLIPQIDELRKIRNPFVHLKEFDHEFNLAQRIFKDMERGKPFRQPQQILADDAKDAIRLMYAIFTTPLR